MTGSTADRLRIRRLMAGVTWRFWPLVKTRSLWLWGALWPRYPASARMPGSVREMAAFKSERPPE